MKIYISGISGTGMGPLALMAKAAGETVLGSDLSAGAVFDELEKAGIEVKIGPQDGAFLQKHLEEIDWFVYTSALPADHAELVMAQEEQAKREKAGRELKVSKRDELTAFLVEKLGLKMVAVAGTHGKTTTTAMIVWAGLKLGLPIAYIVGTTLGFAPSGSYQEKDQFFVYEADEYDRNFLHYNPWLEVITCVSYDHPDIYPTRENYEQAFRQFKAQGQKVIEEGVAVREGELTLAGEARREDARLAISAIMEMVREGEIQASREQVIEIMNEFPGVGRRFERIAPGVYSDYGHHPEEIQVTVETAKEEAERLGLKGVVVVYQPHQNVRQHEVRKGYKKAFLGAEKVFWLPTYLTREDPNLRILKPEELIQELENAEVGEKAELGDKLEGELREYLREGYLVILMTAGPADDWLREKFGD